MGLVETRGWLTQQQILSMFVTLILLMLVDEIINEMNETQRGKPPYKSSAD